MSLHGSRLCCVSVRSTVISSMFVHERSSSLPGCRSSSLSHSSLSLTTSLTPASQLTLQDLEIPAPITRNEVNGSVAISTPLTQDVSGNSRERSEEVSILGRNPDGEALRNIVNKLTDERILRDLHLKHNQRSTAHCKKRTTHLDIPGKMYDLDQHVVQNMPIL